MTEKYINNILFQSSGFNLFGQLVSVWCTCLVKNRKLDPNSKKKIVGRIKPWWRTNVKIPDWMKDLVTWTKRRVRMRSKFHLLSTSFEIAFSKKKKILSWIVSCRGVVQLGGLQLGSPFFSPTNVEALKFFYLLSSLLLKTNFEHSEA